MFWNTAWEENNEKLVLEDLKAMGYCVFDRRKPLDKAHIALVMEYYLKLQALYFPLRVQMPISPFFSTYKDDFKVPILKNAEI